MGNYDKLEYDFIDRTLNLIDQYESLLPQFHFNEQYNYTLLINCLLGLIVMPKERTISFIPKERLTPDFKSKMGLFESVINAEIIYLKDLIIAIRNSIAHFDIKIESYNELFLINEIVFQDTQDTTNSKEIIRFRATEVLPFIRYYSSLLMYNLKNFKHQ